jgi:hypothetical protein
VGKSDPLGCHSYQDKSKPKRGWRSGAPLPSFGFYVLTRLAMAIKTDLGVFSTIGAENT